MVEVAKDAPSSVEKVTAFVTRDNEGIRELLLLHHPFAGIQFPAGTVEFGESAREAVLREVKEETGLTAVSSPVYLGQEQVELPANKRIVNQSATVFSRPDADGFDWAQLRRGITVTVLRQSGNYTQVEYVEFDQIPDLHYVTYSICGWVLTKSLATHRLRTFYQLFCLESTPTHWQVRADHHNFTLFWAARERLPPIVAAQKEWVHYLVPRD